MDVHKVLHEVFIAKDDFEYILNKKKDDDKITDVEFVKAVVGVLIHNGVVGMQVEELAENNKAEEIKEVE